MADDMYFIKSSDLGSLVEVWSSIRLPFEPKGWLLDMRNSVRSVVKSMQGTNDTMLHAVYVSDQEGFCDVENVLLYNVGSGAFAHLCRKGICFERKIAKPPQPKEGYGIMPHYHRYSLMVLEEEPLHWIKEQSLARWTGIHCPALRGENKPHSFWYAIKKGLFDIANKFEVPHFFGIELKITAPKGTVINLASVIKPLLDGIICAFHTHDGTDNATVVNRLAQRLSIGKSVVVDLLMDMETGILGKRNLVHPFGKGVQWNPADDLCVVAMILLNDCMEDNTWSLDGNIFTVAARNI